MITYLRIFFLDYKNGGSLVDRLVTKGVRDHHLAFGYNNTSNLGHVIVALGDQCYEVTIDGTVAYLATFDELWSLPRVFGYYELACDLNEEKMTALQWILNSKLKQKLDIFGSISYALQYRLCLLRGFDGVELEFADNRPIAKVNDTNNLEFCLPYTCTSIANICLRRAIENYSCTFDSHLPTSLFLECVNLTNFGLGSMFTKDAFAIDYV